MKSTLSTKTNC